MGDTKSDRSGSGARRAGRGFGRLLRGIFGEKRVARARESLDVLRDEYRAGKDETAAAEEGEEGPRTISHKEKPPADDDSGS